MPFLFAGVLFLVLLFFWLSGHWFARIVMWLALWPVAVMVIGEAMASAMGNGGKNIPLGILCVAVPGVVAWFVSRAPLYFARSVARSRAGQAGFAIQLRDEAYSDRG